MSQLSELSERIDELHLAGMISSCQYETYEDLLVALQQRTDVRNAVVGLSNKVWCKPMLLSIIERLKQIEVNGRLV